MEIEPIWADYVVYDEEGDISGVRDDSPPEIKEAYMEYLEQKQRYIDRGEMIPR